MASPQKEHGYTPIANELLEVLAMYKFTVYQRAIIDVILRKTYGYGKKEDRISISQFVEATGIKKGHVWETLSSLKKAAVVVYSDNKKVSLNKDWEKWKVPCRRYKSTVPTVQKYRVQELQKKKEKRNIPAKRGTPMKKNKLGKYNEANPEDTYEDVIDIDTGEVTVEPKEKNMSVAYKEIMDWAVARRGFKFLAIPKQYRALALARKNNIQPDDIVKRWEEFEKDKFWIAKGFDFMDVVMSFNKKA